MLVQLLCALVVWGLDATAEAHHRLGPGAAALSITESGRPGSLAEATAAV